MSVNLFGRRLEEELQISGISNKLGSILWSRAIQLRAIQHRTARCLCGNLLCQLASTHHFTTRALLRIYFVVNLPRFPFHWNWGRNGVSKKLNIFCSTTLTWSPVLRWSNHYHQVELIICSSNKHISINNINYGIKARRKEPVGGRTLWWEETHLQLSTNPVIRVYFYLQSSHYLVERNEITQ